MVSCRGLLCQYFSAGFDSYLAHELRHSPRSGEGETYARRFKPVPHKTYSTQSDNEEDVSGGLWHSGGIRCLDYHLEWRTELVLDDTITSGTNVIKWRIASPRAVPGISNTNIGGGPRKLTSINCLKYYPVAGRSEEDQIIGSKNCCIKCCRTAARIC